MADCLGPEGGRSARGEPGDLGGTAGAGIAGDPVLAGPDRLLALGSLRPVPLRDDLAQLRRGVAARGGHVVTLEPLAPPEVTDLVGRVIGGQPGQRLAKLTERAGGNPLYA